MIAPMIAPRSLKRINLKWIKCTAAEEITSAVQVCCLLSVEDFGMGPWDSWCRASRCISLGFVEVHVVVMVVVVGTFGSSLKILSQALNMRHQCAMSLHIPHWPLHTLARARFFSAKLGIWAKPSER